MMGRQKVDQCQLFYLFNLEGRIPTHHLLRRINPVVARIMAELREKLGPFYSEIGRPSIDPELMIRMLIVGYCYGIRSERRLCEEVELHLAYRWFCRLDLDDKVPDHSTFSVNRHGRFRESDAFRHVFEAVVRTCMDTGLVEGEGFAVDASVMEADASRYHGVAPEEADWSAPERQTRAVAEFLGALDDDDPTADRKAPKVISLSDPCSAWTAKANKRVQFGYGLNYLIDIENAVIVDVEATPARTYDEVAAARTMIERTEQRMGSSRNVSPLIQPTAPASSSAGWLAPASRCKSRCGTRAPVRMAPSHAATLRLTGSATSISAPPARCSKPQAMSVTITFCAILRPSAIAMHAYSNRNAVRECPFARSHETSTRMPAITPAHSWAHPSSTNRAMSERRLRCGSRTSRRIIASSACD
jgi:transposase